MEALSSDVFSSTNENPKIEGFFMTYRPQVVQEFDWFKIELIRRNDFNLVVSEDVKLNHYFL